MKVNPLIVTAVASGSKSQTHTCQLQRMSPLSFLPSTSALPGVPALVTTLISDLSTPSNYSLDTEDSIDSMANGFPQQDLRIQSNIGGALGDCVIPRSLSENVTWLHSYLFDDSDYDVTQNVQDTSNTIDDMTKDVVPEEMTDADHA